MDKPSGKNEPLLSIIVPVYNVDNYLRQALDSLLIQNPDSMEIIVVNDGSTDRSGDILEEYAKKDSRIQLIQQENRGLSASRNSGFKKAKGRYIYFFDSDDVLAENALESLLAEMQEKNLDIAAFSGTCIDEAGNRISRKHHYQKPDYVNPLPGGELLVNMMKSDEYSSVISMYMYKRELLANNGFVFTEGFIHEDESFAVKTLAAAGRAASFADIYYFHRIRPDSIMSAKTGIKNMEGWLKAVSEMLAAIEHFPLQKETNQWIRRRAEKLAHNSIKILHSLNRKENRTYRLHDFLTRAEIRKLGPVVRLHSKSSFFYKVMIKITRW